MRATVAATTKVRTVQERFIPHLRRNRETSGRLSSAPRVDYRRDRYLSVPDFPIVTDQLNRPGFQLVRIDGVGRHGFERRVVVHLLPVEEHRDLVGDNGSLH